jgi:catechol 2,3-dioxygenase-like lactoylglutathione lyase family enzyme
MPATSIVSTSDVIAFAASLDLDRARAFYEGVLGLRLVQQDQFACVFDANDTMLRVSAVESLADQGHTVLGWQVADITAAVGELRDAGVEFATYPGMNQDDNGIWTTPSGDQVAWFSDPDGNTLSLTQFG